MLAHWVKIQAKSIAETDLRIVRKGGTENKAGMIRGGLVQQMNWQDKKARLTGDRGHVASQPLYDHG